MIIRNLAKFFLTCLNEPEKLRWISRGLTRLVNEVEAKIRILETRDAKVPDIKTFDDKHKLITCVRQKQTPWSGIGLAECEIPGMVSREECQYYTYIGQFFMGSGKLVELGPWLGRSTFYILQGLSVNPRFLGEKLHVYDDFVWRSEWMNDKVPKGERLANHADFQFLFEKYTMSNYTKTFQEKLNVQKRKITTYDGNDDVEQLVWSGEPVEIIYVDCGRTFEANEAWWKLFVDSFMPKKTLIVLEDWDTHRQVPVRWYNQIKQWIDSKGPSLQLVHELQHGGIATFLYRPSESSPPHCRN